jgi:signal peptidase I
LTKDKREQPQIARRDIVNSAIQIRKRRVQIRQIWESIFVRLLVFLLLVWAVFSFVLGVQTVTSNDMFPTIREGDLAIYIRITEYKNADIVLYRDTIGRIQGTDGAIIDKTGDGLLTIDGNLQPVQKRQGIYYETRVPRESALKYPSMIPKGKYLILGDQREEACDSRVRGLVKKRELKGKVFMVIKRRAL